MSTKFLSRDKKNFLMWSRVKKNKIFSTTSLSCAQQSLNTVSSTDINKNFDGPHVSLTDIYGSWFPL